MQPLEIQYKLAPAAAITLIIHVKPLDVKLMSFSDDCQQVFKAPALTERGYTMSKYINILCFLSTSFTSAFLYIQ